MPVLRRNAQEGTRGGKAMKCSKVVFNSTTGKLIRKEQLDYYICGYDNVIEIVTREGKHSDEVINIPLKSLLQKARRAAKGKEVKAK
jgi:hypothetical protein